MVRVNKALAVLFILLFAVQFSNLQPAQAQAAPTLAETINSVLSNVNVTDSVWNTVFDQIFCRQNASVFDFAITKAQNSSRYADVIFIARLAELNNYTSPIVNSCLIDALENMPMCGSLPITYDTPDSFLVYDRYMVNAYRYAQSLNVSRWNLTIAYSDFVKAYVSGPEKSESGEMLYLNPEDNTALSFSSRYYDEHAETLDMFLQFYLNGVEGSLAYADDAWLNVQAHWNGKIYGYTNMNAGVECEMGNFAQVISQYRNSRGEIPYFDRVISDLENKLLVEEFNSTAWGVKGVVKHSEATFQNRLYETTGSLTALHMLYPNFTIGNQTHFRNMFSTGWQGLINSSLFCNNQFSFMDIDNEGQPGIYNDEASLLGSMTLFLYGIVPQSGSLAIDASNEKYQDYLTCFPASKWQFNYIDHSIRIPVNKGNFTFIFGSQNATVDFIEDGVYDVQFSIDWNNVTSTTKIADITHPHLEPVTLNTLEKNPSPRTPLSPPILFTYPDSTATIFPTARATPTVTPTPVPTPTEQQKQSTPTTSTLDTDNKPIPLALFLAVAFSVIAAVLSAGAIKFSKGKKPQK